MKFELIIMRNDDKILSHVKNTEKYIFFFHKLQHKYTFENKSGQTFKTNHIATNSIIHAKQILDVRGLTLATMESNTT